MHDALHSVSIVSYIKPVQTGLTKSPDKVKVSLERIDWSECELWGYKSYWSRKATWENRLQWINYLPKACGMRWRKASPSSPPEAKLSSTLSRFWCLSLLDWTGIRNRMRKGAALISRVAPIACGQGWKEVYFSLVEKVASSEAHNVIWLI